MIEAMVYLTLQIKSSSIRGNVWKTNVCIIFSFLMYSPLITVCLQTAENISDTRLTDPLYVPVNSLVVTSLLHAFYLS